MKSNPVSKIAFTITLISTSVLLSVWAFLIYKSVSTRSHIVTIEAEAREKSSESTYSNSVRNILRDSKENLEAIDARFVPEESVPEFITMLESQAETSKVRVNLSGIDVTPTSPHAQLQVKVNGFGEWKNVVSFVTALDSMPYASRINNVNFTKQGVGNNAEATTTWAFNLDFVQYLKEEK